MDTKGTTWSMGIEDEGSAVKSFNYIHISGTEYVFNSM